MPESPIEKRTEIAVLSQEAKKYKTADEFVKSQLGERVFWHSSPSGYLWGSRWGLHIGTKKAAKQAIEARIGVPADGKGWDGTKEYGKTLLAGRKTLKKFGVHETGFNVGTQETRLPEEDFYINDYPILRKNAKYSNGELVALDAKPNIIPVKIKGKMTNTVYTPMEDFKANSIMQGQLKKGTAKSGYYYINVGEDEGSISAVVPSSAHIEILKTETQLKDIWNKAKAEGYAGGVHTVRESRGISKLYYTSTDPVFGKVTIKQFIETEVEERGNYSVADVQNWMRKYGLSMNDLAIWVSPKKWIANRYNLFAEEWDKAEKIPESEMRVYEIKGNEGFIIPESDDGDEGYLFVYKRVMNPVIRESENQGTAPGQHEKVKEIIEDIKKKPLRAPEKRDEIRRALTALADSIDRSAITELRNFRPLGMMSEFGAAMGAEPRKGVRIDTPYGPYVFDEKRTPSKERVNSWYAQHKEAEGIRTLAVEYGFGLGASPNTVTGNFRVVERGRRFKEQGMLSPEEEQALNALEKYWQEHPELDRMKGYGVWAYGLEIMVPEKLKAKETGGTGMAEQSQNVQAIFNRYTAGYSRLSLVAVTQLSDIKLAEDITSAIPELPKEDALKIAPHIRALADAKAKEMEAQEIKARPPAPEVPKVDFWGMVKDLKITEVQVEFAPGEPSRGYKNIYLYTYAILENGKRVRMNEEMFKGRDVAEAQKMGEEQFRQRKLYMIGETVEKNVRESSFLFLNRYEEYVKQAPVAVQKRFEESGAITGGTPARHILRITEPEEYYFGTQIEVLQGANPELEPYFTGTIKRLLNNGELVEVHPEGDPREVSFRVPVDRVNVIRLVHQGEPKKIKELSRYYYSHRPPGIGTQPEGYINYESWLPAATTPHGRSAFGWVEYDRPLTPEEISRYELFEDEVELPKLVRELVQFARDEGIDEAMKAIDAEYGRAVWDWLKAQKRIRAGLGQKEQIRAEIIRLAGITAPSPAAPSAKPGSELQSYIGKRVRVTVPGKDLGKEFTVDNISGNYLAGIYQGMMMLAKPGEVEIVGGEQPVADIQALFDRYKRSTVLPVSVLDSPEFMNDEAVAKDISQNLQISMDEALQLVPQFRAIVAKLVHKEEIEGIKERFGIDVEKEAYKLGIDLTEYEIIPAGNRVFLQHRTQVQRKYELKSPAGYMKRKEEEWQEKHRKAAGRVSLTMREPKDYYSGTEVTVSVGEPPNFLNGILKQLLDRGETVEVQIYGETNTIKVPIDKVRVTKLKQQLKATSLQPGDVLERAVDMSRWVITEVKNGVVYARPESEPTRAGESLKGDVKEGIVTGYKLVGFYPFFLLQTLQPSVPPAAKPAQSIQEVKQQVLDSIQAARSVEELQPVLKGIGFLPLPEPEKRQVMDAYQNRYSILMSERPFGVPVKGEEKPKAIGAPTPQQLFEAELRRKAGEARKVSAAPTLTGAVAPRRLEMFEPGAMEKAKAEAEVRTRIEQLGLPYEVHPYIRKLAAGAQDVMKFGAKRGRESVEDMVLARYVRYCPPGTIIDNRSMPRVPERWWVYPPKLRACMSDIEKKLAEAGAGMVKERYGYSQRFRYSIYHDGGLFANENDPTEANNIYDMLVRTYPKSVVELRENFVHPRIHQRTLKKYPAPNEISVVREATQLTSSMRSYIHGAQAVRDVIHYYRDGRTPTRGVLYRARDGTYFVEANDGQVYSSMGWEDVSATGMPPAGRATA